MRTSQTLTAESIGALHNNLITRYLKDHQPATAVTLAVMSNTVDRLAGYLTKPSFEHKAVRQVAQKIKQELLRSDLYLRGTLRPPAEFVPILIEDVIQRVKVSKELADALRRASQLGTVKTSSPEAIQANSSNLLLGSQPWPKNEQPLVDIFLSVANASRDLWFGNARLERGPTRDSQLVISDATGALIGSVLGPLGAILGGAALSIAVSETT
jgi:hypothetical protein